MLDQHNAPKLEPAIAHKGAPAVARFAVAALLAGCAASWADQDRFYANLSGGGEEPPHYSAGYGHLDAIFDTGTHTLSWIVHYSGLTGSRAVARFHGPISYVGSTSDHEAPIQIVAVGKSGGVFRGSAVLDASQTRDLKALRWFITIHTPAFPGGEIRGPVIQMVMQSAGPREIAARGRRFSLQRSITAL